MVAVLCDMASCRWNSDIRRSQLQLACCCVDDNLVGRDSGNLVNPFMRVTWVALGMLMHFALTMLWRLAKAGFRPRLRVRSPRSSHQTSWHKFKNHA